MSGKIHRKCRAAAYHNANRVDLWNQGKSQLKWYQKLFARLFKRSKQKYGGWIARWYKRVIKQWSKQAYQNMHDPDFVEMERTRRKLAKRRRS